MRRRHALLVLVLATTGLLAGPGCFVAEELDGGAKPAGPASSRTTEESESELASAGRETLDAVGEWWDEVGSAEPDPEDGIVRCSMRGSIQYTRESTCRTSGGEVLGR